MNISRFQCLGPSKSKTDDWQQQQQQQQWKMHYHFSNDATKNTGILHNDSWHSFDRWIVCLFVDFLMCCLLDLFVNLVNAFVLFH
jgi:hypothetical protein